MNKTPPLPQPSGATCSNCGAAQAAGAKRCTQCGAALPAVAGSALPPALRVLLTIPLFLGAVGFGGLGACLGIVSLADLANPSNGLGMGIGFYLLTGAAIVAGLACLWLINRLNRRK